MTHAELVEIAARWLRTAAGCSVVMPEMSVVCRTGEIPDAIGFRGDHTILIECKTSRADFFADRAKSFRQMPERGMGALRFMLAPAGMIKVEELPAGWGLIEPAGMSAVRVHGANPKQPQEMWVDFYHGERATDCEARILLSGLNRIRVALGEPEFRRCLKTRLAPKAVA